MQNTNPVQLSLLKLNPPNHFDTEYFLTRGLIHQHENWRADQYRSAQARLQFLAGRVLLRRQLGTVTGFDYKDICFATNPQGQPYLPNSPWHFNLSHSQPWIAAAIDMAPLGVDIEVNRHHVDHLGIARHHFSEEECAWLQKRKARHAERFTALWSLKEAYLKAIGLGIATDLRKMQWRAHSCRHIEVRSPLDARPWFCQLYRPQSEVWVSVCSNRPRAPISIQYPTLDC